MRRHRRSSAQARWLSSPIAAVLGALAVALLLAGCGEKPQDPQTRQVGRTVTRDTKPWDADPTRFTAAGFTKGNQAAYEDALKQRMLGQNEYVRIGASTSK
jgi:hypothetical protein